MSDDQGALMPSFDPSLLHDAQCDNSVSDHSSLPDVLSNELQSLNLTADCDKLSFLLLDDRENLLIDNGDIFARKLGCEPSTPSKVVSIVGNTGEGKSYTLNQVLFEGEEVFSTSPHQESCTIGVWAAYEPRLDVIVLDTEGMLGQAGNENQRMRQLLKVLAVSDIVIYKTKAERLHNDLFYFLGDASRTYNEHFHDELQKVGDEGSILGPKVIVVHETRHTDVLGGRGKSAAESVLRDRLRQLKQDASAFSKINYVGYKAEGNGNGSKHFKRVRDLITKELEDTSVRSPRKVSLVYNMFKALNTKFNGAIDPHSHRSFPDEYFTCMNKCLSCTSRCSRAVNHEGAHKAEDVCVYQKKLENKRFFCMRCYQNGRRIEVIPKTSSAQESTWLGLANYAWSGYVLECRVCGIIYRSREHWYGNETPESKAVVQTEITHIWPGERSLHSTPNTARIIMDEVNFLSQTVGTLSAAPTKAVSNWMADQIAPDYWRPNSDIAGCFKCDRRFEPTEKIHHCRACGEGFCDKCSEYRRPVVERGWGNEPVRVCKRCYDAYTKNGLDMSNSSDPGDIQARKVSEKVVGTLGTLSSLFVDYPLNVIKDSARPEYWVPDEDIRECCTCKKNFADQRLKIHHCRACGEGVCDSCSRARRPVHDRGWDQPVRVCDECKIKLQSS